MGMGPNLRMKLTKNSGGIMISEFGPLGPRIHMVVNANLGQLGNQPHLCMYIQIIKFDENRF